MARRVIWTESAWADVQAAADYIEKDSRRYAMAFVREVRDAALSLKSMAARGRVVPEVSNPAVRELFVRNYRLIYLVAENDVHIIAFVHGARDLWRWWDSQQRPT